MERHHIFSIAVVASAISGMTPMAWIVVAAFSWIWMPAWLPWERGPVIFLSMLITSTTLLLLAGVPAALYERLVGDDPTGRRALSIWAGTATAITFGLIALTFASIAPG
jgi:hypothetical protein